jgi:hypothetical protein
MNKSTSRMLIATIAGIIIAGTFTVVLPTVAYADLRGGNAGSEAGGRAVINTVERGADHNHQSTNGGNANGGNGGDANGGNACIKAGCRS